MTGKSHKFYDHDVKTKVCMKRLSAGITDIGRATDRKGAWASMYKQEEDFTPDFYDSVKIANDFIKTKKTTKAHFSMKQQTQRKHDTLLGKTEFHKNVLRENARVDYIKQLLRDSVDDNEYKA